MLLEQKREAFEAQSDEETARGYADALIDAWRDELIGRDTLRAGFIAIGERLTGGLCDLDSPVEVRIV